MPRAEAHALLAQKLIEEAFEVRGSTTNDLIEELADVLEVVEALRAHSGIEIGALTGLREEKRAKRGGFDNLIYLEETDLQPLEADRDSTGRLPLFSEEALSVPGRRQPLDKRVQVRSTKTPEELLRFTLSLVPPAGRAFGPASFEVRQGDLKIEVRYQQAEALVSVTRATSREAPGQLTLFPEHISKSLDHEHSE
jgi:predicted house-cleaning noncanonical NTP pyrophosphatase (MazG superfamily)